TTGGRHGGPPASAGDPGDSASAYDDPPDDEPSADASPSPSASPRPSASPSAKPVPGPDLTDPHKKEIAMELGSSAEKSSLNWRAQYRYIQDIHDGRGYTGGIIGFCSGTNDMLELVQLYAKRKPGNVLAKYLPALKQVNGSASHTGLDPNYVNDW